MTSNDLYPDLPPSPAGDATTAEKSTVVTVIEESRTLCSLLRQTSLDEAQQQLLTGLERQLQTLLKLTTANQGESQAEPVPPPSSRSLNILLAEDNLLTQKLMVRMLELRGHRVTVVENGENAVNAVAAASYDILLMDVRMPVMDGMQATLAIRKNERQNNTRHLPILAVTVLTSEENQHQALVSGMDGFHSKPVKADLLFAEIDRILTPGDTPPSPQCKFTKRRLDTLKHLYRSVDGDIQLVGEVVELFFTQSQEQLPKIRRAVENQAANELMEVAHSLKGAAGAFGPSRIHELAYQLEMAGRTVNLDQAPLLLEELEKEIQATNIALRIALDKEDFNV